MLPLRTQSSAKEQSNENEPPQTRQQQLNKIRLLAFSRRQKSASRPATANKDTGNSHAPSEQSPSSLKQDKSLIMAPPSTPMMPIHANNPSHLKDAADEEKFRGSTDGDTGSSVYNATYLASQGRPAMTLKCDKDTVAAGDPSVSYAINKNGCRTALQPIPEELTAPAPSLTSETEPEYQSWPTLSNEEVLKAATRLTVANGLAVLLDRGPAACAKHLLEHGTMDHISAAPVCMVASEILREITRKYPQYVKLFVDGLRFGAMGLFREHWKLDGIWLDAAKKPLENAHLTLKGLNVSGFLGSLFTINITSACDMHLCLDLLFDGPQHFHRLCAIHALLVQANDKLCKRKSAPFMERFREKLSALLWTATEPGQFLIADAVGTIDAWFDTQESKRAAALPPVAAPTTTNNQKKAPKPRGKEQRPKKARAATPRA